KVTVPVGVLDPPEPEITVAVNVTDWPDDEGFEEELRAVVVTRRQPFSRIETSLEVMFATARSGLPSPSTSPAATEYGFAPTARPTAAWNVASPLPKRSETSLEA